MRETADSAAAPTARCRKFRRGSFISIPPSIVSLFDHLVGAAEQQRGHGEADCLCGTDVDHQLELGGLYDRQVGGLGANQNSAGVVADLEVCIAQVCAVGQ